MDIYIQNNGQRIGPYTIDQVNGFLAEGSIQFENPAWHSGMDDWIPLSEIPGVSKNNHSSPPIFDSAAFAQNNQPEAIIATTSLPVSGAKMEAAKTIHESDNTLISPKKLPAPKTAIAFGAFLTLLGAALMFESFSFFKGPILGMRNTPGIEISKGLAVGSLIIFTGSLILIFISIKFFLIVKVCSECGNRIPNHWKCPDCKATF